MTHYLRRLRLLYAVLIFIVAVSSAAFADGNRDRTQVGNTIYIGPGEEVQDATCFGCSIRVRGHVSGDVTAFGGSILVEDQGQVNGDATVFGGDVRIDKEVKVGGDVTVFGGRIRRDPTSTVGGDVTTMGGPGWMFLIFLVPLIFLGAFVALIVWLIRRLMRPSLPATA
jgi:cytoskeletal protein CcmA (bactofilin family)